MFLGQATHYTAQTYTPQANVPSTVFYASTNGLDPGDKRSCIIFSSPLSRLSPAKKNVATSKGSLFSLRWELIICFLPVLSTRDVNYSSEYCLTRNAGNETLSSVNEYYYLLKILISAITH